MADDIPEKQVKREKAAADRRKRKLISALLSLDVEDLGSAMRILYEYQTTDARSGRRALLGVDDIRAAKRLISFVADAILSPGLEPRIRLWRALASTEAGDGGQEGRRAFVVKAIELGRGEVFQVCERCGKGCGSNECDLCKAPIRPCCGSFLSAISELEPRFSTLDPDAADIILGRWRSCTLVAAKLSIECGAFGDSGNARMVQKRFDLAYRKVFSREPESHAPGPVDEDEKAFYEATGSSMRIDAETGEAIPWVRAGSGLRTKQPSERD